MVIVNDSSILGEDRDAGFAGNQRVSWDRLLNSLAFAAFSLIWHSPNRDCFQGEDSKHKMGVNLEKREGYVFPTLIRIARAKFLSSLSTMTKVLR
jgi:hypothetical protein